MSDDTIPLEEQEPVRRFVALAGHFCTLLETHESYDEHGFIREASRLLGELYGAVWGLGSFVPDEECDAPDPDIDHSTLLQAIAGFHEKLVHPAGWYTFASRDQEGHTQDLAVGWIVDDFRTIYSDLKEGLLRFESGIEGAGAEAVCDWWFGIGIWGRHVLGALRALHYMYWAW
ncbi:MAG: DUF5063 domain-containing protein [Anaerolineae bacterium]|nr:DUF5063 domain-containing protein [Anaerolineae bacterium]